MIRITNGDAWIRDAQKELAKFEDQCVGEVRKATRTLITALFLRTPVWSGETVRNYAIGLGRAPSGGSLGNIGPKPPITSTAKPHAMGPEENRAANEEAAMANADSILNAMKKLETVFITNRVANQKWDLIDNGSAPSAEMARNPGGVSVLAEQTARSQLEHFK